MSESQAAVETKRALPLDCYVILHIRVGPPYPDPAKTPHIAEDGPFKLSDDIWIEGFDQEFAQHIQRACEPANYGFHNSVWDRHLYAFVRREPESEKERLPGTVVRDDGILPLFSAIALSRLIRPTTTGNRYCAKILTQPEADPAIQALRIGNTNPDVTIAAGSQDWLSPEDGLELRQLMPWTNPSKEMHKRVYRAFWNHEDSMRTYFLDFRIPIVVAGLEALTTVETNRGLTARFVRRVGQLASEFSAKLSDDELEKAYKLRSEVIHGRKFLFDLTGVLPPSEHRPLYDKLETLLRQTVKKCLLDQSFCDRFADDSSVLKYYP